MDSDEDTDTFGRIYQVVMLGIVAYEVWMIMVPESIKIEVKARLRKLRRPKVEDPIKARNRLIWELAEIQEACPHQLADEVRLLS